jgi:hypothetical protein
MKYSSLFLFLFILYSLGLATREVEFPGAENFKVEADASYSDSGIALAVGDVNGDGIGDIIVSTSDEKVYLLLGRETWPSLINLASSPPTAVIFGKSGGGKLGTALAVGDINGDGILDIITSAPFLTSSGREKAGEVYVILGRSSFPSMISLTSIPSGVTVLTIKGASSGENLGKALAVGDVNSDGKDDIILGAPGASPLGRSNAGRVYLILGHPISTSQTIDLNASPADFTIIGAAGGDNLGSAVASGNVNGDTAGDDIIVSAPQAESNRGKVYIIYGSSSLSGTHDLGEDVSDITILGEIDSSLGSALASGDLDNDGIDGIVIGAEVGNKVYAIYGTPNFPTNLNLQTNPANITIRGKPGGAIGGSIAVGDVSGDYKADIIIGSPSLNEVSVMFCQRFPDPQVKDLATSSLNIEIKGDTGELGKALGVGDIDKGGLNDIIVGAPTEGFGKVYGLYGETIRARSTSLNASQLLSYYQTYSLRATFEYSIPPEEIDSIFVKIETPAEEDEDIILKWSEATREFTEESGRNYIILDRGNSSYTLAPFLSLDFRVKFTWQCPEIQNGVIAILGVDDKGVETGWQKPTQNNFSIISSVTIDDLRVSDNTLNPNKLLKFLGTVTYPGTTSSPPYQRIEKIDIYNAGNDELITSISNLTSGEFESSQIYSPRDLGEYSYYATVTLSEEEGDETKVITHLGQAHLTVDRVMIQEIIPSGYIFSTGECYWGNKTTQILVDILAKWEYRNEDYLGELSLKYKIGNDTNTLKVTPPQHLLNFPSDLPFELLENSVTLIEELEVTNAIEGEGNEFGEEIRANPLIEKFSLGWDDAPPPAPQQVICRADGYTDPEYQIDDDPEIYITWEEVEDAGAGINYYALEYNNPTPTQKTASPNRGKIEVPLGVQGECFFYVRVCDNVENWSEVAQAKITLVIPGPQNPSLKIKEAPFTNQRLITLILKCEDARERFITGDIIPTEEIETWRPFQPGADGQEELKVELTQGDGLKNIKVKFRDEKLYESEEKIASITLDTTPPLSQPQIEPTNPTQTKIKNNDSVKVKGSVSESGCTIIEIKAFDEDAQEVPFKKEPVIRITDQNKFEGEIEFGEISSKSIKVRIQIKDRVENLSLLDASYSNVLLVDNEIPTEAKVEVEEVTIKPGEDIPTIGKTKVKLKLTCQDESKLEVFIDGNLKDGPHVRTWFEFPRPPVVEVELEKENKINTIEVSFRDEAGNKVKAYTRVKHILSVTPGPLQEALSGLPFPNPTSRMVLLPYQLKTERSVLSLKVYNLLGQQVTKLNPLPQKSPIKITPKELVRAGIYFYILETPTKRFSKQITLIR